MPTFDFQTLLWWGLPLAALPLLIHLINLLRYRRVRWAAMEFLLASQRKYRSRVLLRQLVLLALRTAAVAGLVLALAQPRWRTALGSLLGGGRATHLVLLDDSFSMGDLSAGGEAAFERGKRAVERIAADVAATGGGEISLGLFSELAAAAGPRLAVERQPADEGAKRVREVGERARASWTAASPADALGVAARMVEAEPAADRTVWLVSDFRDRDWRGGEAADLVRRLAASAAGIRLVDCGREGQGAGNLSVVRVEPVGGVPAVGVLVPIEVEIRNDAAGVARDVAVELFEDGVGRPGLRIAEIPPGGTASRRFDVRFTQPGGHVVEARLPADVVPADDARTCVLEVVEGVDVLLVDGDPASAGGRGGDAFYVAAALAPGSGAPTGLRPRVEPAAALGSIDLAPFDCIWLLDVERLEPPAVAALEAYARAGGGVVFFGGPRTGVEAVNRMLHRGGEGLYPVPLAGDVELLRERGSSRVPDVVVEDHPVVAVLSGQRNPLLDAVRIDRSLAVERGFDDAAVPGLRRLLSLRSGAPLVIEKPFGAGLVVAVLTTAAPAWNNWARGNPSWVVVMLELENHLARARRRAAAVRVGEPLAVPLQAAADEPEVDFILPPDGVIVRQTATGADGRLTAVLPATAEPGAYAARWRRRDGTERERVFAVNVDPAEGELERFGRERIERALAGVAFRYDPADALDAGGGTLAGTPLAPPLLAALVAILAVEQLVAFAASYHPVSSAPGRR